jgi:DNA-binding Xre family transcriptional regulator
MITSNLFAVWTARELADGCHLTYRQVAADTGLSSATLVAWKLDTVERFDKGTLATLCQYFECEVADLIVRRV